MFEDLKFPLSLGSDNHAGVHPRVMEALAQANRGHAHAYGLDEVSALTLHEFQRLFGLDVDVHYVFNGTGANVSSLAPLVRSFECVITSEQAHLHRDECGAPEKFLGAKLWTLPSRDGKIRPEQTQEVLSRLGDQHFSQARVVSLTQPTELGVSYTLDELRAWREFCRARNLMLHIDGARISNSCAFLKTTFKEMMEAAQPDVVAFGGTKNGLLGAEAVLLFSPLAKEKFKFYRKQAMQLPSKTRYLAAQFYAYLKDDLWLDLANHSTQLARDLSRRLERFPEFRLAFPVESNALFVNLPKEWVKPLREKFFFYIWESDPPLARWMISWDWSEALNQELENHILEVQRCFPVK